MGWLWQRAIKIGIGSSRTTTTAAAAALAC